LLIEIHMPIERLIEINRLYVGFLGDWNAEIKNGGFLDRHGWK
jgi:hypothetical protein